MIRAEPVKVRVVRAHCSGLRNTRHAVKFGFSSASRSSSSSTNANSIWAAARGWADVGRLGAGFFGSGVVSTGTSSAILLRGLMSMREDRATAIASSCG